MAQGLRQHTHEERRRIVEMLVPLIKRHVGTGLIALAATGSFAREADGPYSDIELIGFVKKRPDSDRASVKFIHDGILIDVWFLTRVDYLYIHRQKIGAEWPYAGSNNLMPLVNEQCIRETTNVPLNLTLEERLLALRDYWPLVQEASAKVLTAAAHDDLDSTRFLFWQMAEKFCVALSFINGRPFSTRAAIFAEARTFQTLPMHIELLSIGRDTSSSSAELADRARIVFDEMEALVQSFGLELYAKSLDQFVSPLTAGRRIRRRLQIGRRIRRATAFMRSVKSALINAEFQRSVLDSLSQPIETGEAVVARANAHVRYPARFQLVAAMNPCRCGYLSDPAQACSRVPKCGADYQARISGPLFDRIDLHVEVPGVSASDLCLPPPREGSAEVAARVARARDIQRERFADHAIRTNAEAEGELLDRIATPEAAGMKLLTDAAERMRLSARGYSRVLRVARTIADLGDSAQILRPHMAEALSYRRLSLQS